MSVDQQPFGRVGRKFESSHGEPSGIYEVLNNIEGQAIFAFIEENESILSGHFVLKSMDEKLRQFQIIGKEELCETDECICAGGYLHLCLYFIEKNLNLQARCRVEKYGGNFLNLKSRDASRISFQAEQILADIDRQTASLYFPKLAQIAHANNLHLIFNIGTLRVQQLRLFSSSSFNR